MFPHQAINFNYLKGFGEFKDEAEVAFWTGILGVFIQYCHFRTHSEPLLVSTFFLTQFVTSLLWVRHTCVPPYGVYSLRIFRPRSLKNMVAV